MNFIFCIINAVSPTHQPIEGTQRETSLQRVVVFSETDERQRSGQ